MKVAYLVNQYPLVSHTFIRREIAAVEAEGVSVLRYSIRRSPIGFVDSADQAEAEKTVVILDQGARGLLLAVLRAVVRRPRRFFRALRLAARTGWRSERGLLRNLIYLAEACVLREALVAGEVGHVHAHFGTNSAAVAMLCRALGGPGYSFTVHGPEEFDKAPLLALPDKIARARFVVGISNFGRSQIYRHCSHREWGKVHVVPCGVDGSFLEAPIAPIPAAARMVSVGRLSEQKGHLLLIDALARLKQAGRAFEMVLVGDGETRPQVERAIARHRLTEEVTIGGWATEAVVRQQISLARALVLPSFAEGLPVVIMEAMALGRPVVSTYVAGIPELVQPGKNGWLVPAGSVDDLVLALEDLLATPPERLLAMGLDARERVRLRHDAALIGRRLGNMFRTAVSER